MIVDGPLVTRFTLTSSPYLLFWWDMQCPTYASKISTPKYPYLTEIQAKTFDHMLSYLAIGSLNHFILALRSNDSEISHDRSPLAKIRCHSDVAGLGLSARNRYWDKNKQCLFRLCLEALPYSEKREADVNHVSLRHQRSQGKHEFTVLIKAIKT